MYNVCFGLYQNVELSPVGLLLDRILFCLTQEQERLSKVWNEKLVNNECLAVLLLMYSGGKQSRENLSYIIYLGGRAGGFLVSTC